MKRQLFDPVRGLPAAVHQEIIDSRVIDKTIEVLFATTLFVEGLNVENTNVAAVHYLTKAHPVHIVQLCGRSRKKAPEAVYIYCTSSNKQYQEEYDCQGRQHKILAEVEAICVGLNEIRKLCANTTCHYRNEREEAAEDWVKSSVAPAFWERFRIKEGRVTPDYLGINYQFFEEDTRKLYRDLRKLIVQLAEYEFSWQGMLEEKELLLSDDYATCSQEVEQERQMRFEAVLEWISEHEESKLNQMLDERADIGRYETELCWRFIFLRKYYTQEDALDLLRQAGENGRKFNDLRVKINFQLFLESSRRDWRNCTSNQNTDFFDHIYNEVWTDQHQTQRKQVWTSEEILDVIREAVQKSGLQGIKPEQLTQTKATHMIRRMFTFERFGRKKRYRLIDDNPVGKQIRPDAYFSEPLELQLEPEDADLPF
jgi:hypothetical protein